MKLIYGSRPLQILLLVTLAFIGHSANALRYNNLSDQFDIAVSIRVNTEENPDFDSTYLKISVFEKESKNCIQVIRKKHFWIWDKLFITENNARSYSTHFNEHDIAVDGDYGDVIIADLNFDGLDDFAVIYDAGLNTGPSYYYYFQRPNKTFYRQVFLSETMLYFPTVIDKENKRLITRVRSGVTHIGETTYQYNPKKESWYLLARRRIKV